MTRTKHYYPIARVTPEMPANVYECMFLLDTNKVAGDVQVGHRLGPVAGVEGQSAEGVVRDRRRQPPRLDGLGHLLVPPVWR